MMGGARELTKRTDQLVHCCQQTKEQKRAQASTALFAASAQNFFHHLFI